MSATVKVPKKKIGKLKKDLAGHSLKALAKKLKCTESAIYKTLNGESYSEKIIEGCIDFRDELMDRSKKLAARI